MSDIKVNIQTAPVKVRIIAAQGAAGAGADIPAAIHAATAVTVPADADEASLVLSPSWELRKITWANIKAWVKGFLGSAAQLNVGTTAATVASGDHTHSGIYATSDQGTLASTALQEVPSATVQIMYDKDYILISGDLTSDGVTPVVFPNLWRIGYDITSGRYYWGIQLGPPPSPNYTAEWIDGPDYWSLHKTISNPFLTTVAEWRSSDNVDSPDLVTTWTPQGIATGTPSIGLEPAQIGGFIGQRVNVGTGNPYDVWECTGPALTDWTQIFDATNFDPAGSASAITPETLNLVIGTNVQAYDSDLTTWAGKTPYAGTITVTTGKTFDCTGTLTLSGTDGSTLNIGTGGTLGTAAYTASTAYSPADARSANKASLIYLTATY